MSNISPASCQLCYNCYILGWVTAFENYSKGLIFSHYPTLPFLARKFKYSCNLSFLGNLTYASKDFLADVKHMYQMFCDLNPPEKIRSHCGIVQCFANFYNNQFPQYDIKVVKLVAKLFVHIRLGTINEKTLQNSTKYSKTKTRRGAMKRAQQSFD